MFPVAVWVLPLLSALVWLITLFAMLRHWISLGRPIYSYTSKGQTIPFVSDVAAQEMYPVFVMGSVICVVFLNASLMFKHRRSRPSMRFMWKKKNNMSQTWSHLSTFLTAIGSIGLVLLAYFDRLNHPDLHRAFLTIYVASFSVGAVVAALESLQSCISTGWKHQLLTVTLLMRLCFGGAAAGLGIAFWFAWRDTEITRDLCAIIEWTLGITFTGHIACFASDLLPSTLALREGGYMELV